MARRLQTPSPRHQIGRLHPHERDQVGAESRHKSYRDNFMDWMTGNCGGRLAHTLYVEIQPCKELPCHSSTDAVEEVSLSSK